MCPWIISLNLENDSTDSYCNCPHFTDEPKELQKGEVKCLSLTTVGGEAGKVSSSSTL